METVPIIRLDHLTDEQRRAYALAHNRTAELSGWDFLIRDEELAEITDIDMSAFGFQAYDGDIDQFFDEGVMTKEKTPVFGVKVVCEENEVEDLMELLKENGYDPTKL